ncbi:MAG: phosphate acetyltransferase [Rhizobiales bacterium]|nr:phosphate acetyltransferase [Hyphomicrobiales bacterium]
MPTIDRFIDSAKAIPRSIVLPEGTDQRVLAAARHLVDEKIASVIVLGDPKETLKTAADASIDLAAIELVDPSRHGETDRLAAGLADRNKKIDADQALEMISQPLLFGGMMVAGGMADAMIAGAANETGKVISAGLKTVGLAPGINRLSSYFLMAVPNFMGSGPREFIFADCAVNIDPDPQELADITIASAQSAAKLLTEEPRVALLSFSTKGSARAEQVDKVTAALDIVRRRAPELTVDGELQADASFVPAVAERKVKDGAGVAGAANVLIFPDLNSGNIGYKLVQYMGNADAIGPFFQGFAKPVCDLSRGCSVDDIIGAAIIMLATA